ncbi:MAG: BrnT family toxin [Pseudomonadota bacterium]
MEFEWDDAKDRSNQRKHGLSFSEAKQLFAGNRDYLEIFDVSHSDVEDRFIAIGAIRRGVVVVVYTEREEDVIRIIGARFATKRERERFQVHMAKH